MPETILLDSGSAIARLTLHRPDRLNRFTVQMHADFREALAEVRSSRARVLVLTGSGRAFCSGQDLAAGAGANLALACDIVIAAKSAVFRDFMGELGRTSDYREAVAAFMEKRVPTFSGE